MKIDIPRLFIAAPQSGSGKTIVASGLMALLARERKVQGFKVGPDYIDAMYHAAATGRSGRNLDGWMLPEEAVLDLFARACRGADIALVEGVMGLFDGFDGRSDSGSTAQMAKLLGAPVLLVIDVSKMARSVAALARGFCDYDPDLNLAGVICNRVGSPSHAAVLADALADAGIEVLGMLPRTNGLVVPERHLGLLTAVEDRHRAQAMLAEAADLIAANVDVPRIAALAETAEALEFEAPDPPQAAHHGVRIAVGRDEAFCFYYEDNLDLLRQAGAELVFFSPLRDGGLPEGCAGIYLGGGYPELYAAQLSENRALLAALRQAHAEDMPIYAECGGLMLLSESITDLQGKRFPMAGILPGAVHMQHKLSLGYCHVHARRHTLLLREGEALRGHEFHYSSWDAGEAGGGHSAYSKTSRRSGEDVPEGYAAGNLLASYVHLHFAACPRLAQRFVERCVKR